MQVMEMTAGEQTPKPSRADHPIELMARAYGLTVTSHDAARRSKPADHPAARRIREACAPSAAGRSSEIKKNRRLEVGPFATFYFECYETMLHQVQEMLLHREGRRGADPRRARGLQSADPAGQRAGRHGDVRDRRSGPPRPRAGDAGRRREPGLHPGRRRGRSAACPRATRNARATTARPRRCSSCAFPSRAAQVAAFRGGAGDVVVGFDHPNYGHMAVMPPAVRVSDFCSAARLRAERARRARPEDKLAPSRWAVGHRAAPGSPDRPACRSAPAGRARPCGWPRARRLIDGGQPLDVSMRASINPPSRSTVTRVTTRPP